MIEPQAPSPVAGRGSLLTLVVTLVLLVGLVFYLFCLPLRPTAWGGPRGKGPFEDCDRPGAGWYAGDARIHLGALAARRSPERGLGATAEALTGYYALVALARFVLFWVVLRRLGGSDLLATLGVAAAVLPVMFGAPRQNESEIGLLLFVVLQYATPPARVPWRLAVVGLPALFVVWANVHTSVTLGIAWLTVIAAGRAIEWWRARRRGDIEPASWLRLVVAIVLCIGAAFINPDGPALFINALAAAKNPNMPALTDWQPVDFSKPAGMPWGYFATIAALLVVQLVGPRAYPPTALLVILTFGIWPLVQQRGLAYWWLIVPWLVVPQIPPLVGRSSPWPRWVRRATPVAILLALLATPAARWLATGRPRAIEDVVSHDTPWRVACELAAEGPDSGPYLPELREVLRSYPSGRYRGAILCDASMGDFLAWVVEGDTTRPLMLYTRPETINRDHWAEAFKGLEGQGDWWEILGRHQVNLVVIDERLREKLAARLRRSSAWRTVEHDHLLVAVRREPKLPAESQGP